MMEGDIYRWSYKKSDDNDRFSYWAKSRIAIVRNGRLHDTYWMFDLENCHSTSDGRNWSLDEATHTLELQLLANINDLQKDSFGKADYYDDADIVNLNHANCSSGNFYIRKGAERSRTKMVDVAKHKREKSISEMVWAAESVRRLDGTIRMIENGEPLDGIWF